MKTVVLIDDDNDFRMLFALAFEAHDITTRAFSSAIDGFHFLTESETLPDFVLVDWNMPDLSGAEFIKKLRADARLRKIKVILVSGCNDIAQIAERSGAHGYIGKPFGLEQVDQLIQKEMADDFIPALRLAGREDATPTLTG